MTPQTSAVSHNQQVVAVGGDLVGSSQLHNRAEVQAILKSSIEKVNSEFASLLLVPFQIVLGDEFQAALKPHALPDTLELTWRFQCLLYPVHVRFVIGLGGLDTPLLENPGEMDGEAFRRARDAMMTSPGTFYQMRIVTGDAVVSELINHTLRLMEIVRSRWSDHHWEYVIAYQDAGTQQGASDILSVSRQAVSKGLNIASYRELRKTREIDRNASIAYCRNQMSCISPSATYWVAFRTMQPSRLHGQEVENAFRDA